MKDLFGKAMFDYYSGNNPEPIFTATSISDMDEMDIAYMFRDYRLMPKLEQKALDLCRGTVLDIGCGAGSHALYLQNDRKLQVTAIDISPNAIKTCLARGLKNVAAEDFYNYASNQLFDTILLLMNGTGICGSLKSLHLFLQKIKSLLAVNGQVLIDSTDIRYMYDKDHNHNIILPFVMEYFGELQFFLTYKNEQEIPFNWLYLDFETLYKHAIANGFSCELTHKGKHGAYLATLKVI